MSKTKKLDTAHLQEIQDLQDKFINNTNLLGNVSIKLHVLKTQIDATNNEQQLLIEEFEKLQQQEQALLDTMRERYGDGQVNIVEGTFTPTDGLDQ